MGSVGEPGGHFRAAPGGPACEEPPSFSIVALKVSCGSQSMDVRLLSRSEAMILEAAVFCLEDFSEGGRLSSLLISGGAVLHTSSLRAILRESC